jgi:hypothetical protein
MSNVQTFGWCSVRDLTNQCAGCDWLLIQHKLACCEFDKPGFPHAQQCEKFEKADESA